MYELLPGTAETKGRDGYALQTANAGDAADPGAT
jgi:hypothetical protein